MFSISRRCECLWCGQTFYSEDFYKFGTCASCLIHKIVTPVPRLTELLKLAEREAIKELEAIKKNR